MGTQGSLADSEKTAGQSKTEPKVEVVNQHIVEFVSDSGEGAQTAGQLFGTSP